MDRIIVNPGELSGLPNELLTAFNQRLGRGLMFHMIEDLSGAVQSFEGESAETGYPVDIEFLPLKTEQVLVDIFQTVWSRPTVLHRGSDEHTVSAILGQSEQRCLGELQKVLDEPLLYRLEGEEYDDVTLKQILESTEFELSFKESFKEINGIFGSVAKHNLNTSLRALHEICYLADR